ncbi:hypothetical protein BJX63DRAFT_387144 [Aspergillus granulosus]|uniref:Uncharacterized protein n=1 Tax=Aspergillus granulosus TaxID=176169 RepID=A0ABR4HMK2_9EURO
MPWTTEGILAFVTLIATIPTGIIAMYTIYKRWRGYRALHPTPNFQRPSRQIDSPAGRASLEMGTVPPVVPGRDPPRWLSSVAPHRPRDTQSLAEEGLLAYYCAALWGCRTSPTDSSSLS